MTRTRRLPRLPRRLGPTHELLIDLYARLRLACEALTKRAEHPIRPADINVDDLAPAERDRLRRCAIDDIFALINASNATLPPAARPGAPLRRTIVR